MAWLRPITFNLDDKIIGLFSGLHSSSNSHNLVKLAHSKSILPHMINEYTYFLASPNGSEPFGIGLYLLASRLDHSCVPTATVVFRGRELRVMAEKEVDGGNILQIIRKKNNSCSKIIFSISLQNIHLWRWGVPRRQGSATSTPCWTPRPGRTISLSTGSSRVSAASAWIKSIMISVSYWTLI